MCVLRSLLSDLKKACLDQRNRIGAATTGQMNRLLVAQDWQQVEHNSRPDLLFNYFPTDPGLADYISRLSRQLVHHLPDALIVIKIIYLIAYAAGKKPI